VANYDRCNRADYQNSDKGKTASKEAVVPIIYMERPLGGLSFFYNTTFGEKVNTPLSISLKKGKTAS
jgi:hypothetical protein